MDALILVVMLVALTAWVAAPLYRPGPSQPPGAGDPAARRRALISRLSELELDHVSGLVGDAEYARQRAELEADAATLTAVAGTEPGPRTD